MAIRMRRKALRKGPKRQRKRTVSVRSYCRRGARRVDKFAKSNLPF